MKDKEDSTIIRPETAQMMEPIAVVISVADDVKSCKEGDTILFTQSQTCMRCPKSLGDWTLFINEKDLVAVLHDDVTSLLEVVQE